MSCRRRCRHHSAAEAETGTADCALPFTFLRKKKKKNETKKRNTTENKESTNQKQS